MVGFPAARVGDFHICALTPVPPGLPIIPPTSVNVMIGNMPAARMTDRCACVGPPPANVDAILKGSTTVFINKLPAARMLDPTVKGGTITTGWPTVLIGDVGVATPPTLSPSVVPPICLSLRAELDEMQAARDNAQMAGAVYGEGALPPNTTPATEDQLDRLGLIDTNGVNRLEMPGSDFGAAVYVTTDPVTGQEHFTVAFQGTNPMSREDWRTNRQQAFGQETPYYNRAMEIGRTVSQSDAGRAGNVSFTGHSLGGGLASAASASSGAPAHSFNAAGLHPATAERYTGNQVDPSSLPVRAYYVQGDALSVAQDNTGLPNAGGDRRPLAPGVPHHWTDVAGGVAGRIGGAMLGGGVGGLAGGAAGHAGARGVRLHLMDAVMESIDAEIARIEAARVESGCP